MLTQKELKRVLSYDAKTGEFRWRIASGCVKVGDLAGTIWKRSSTLWRPSSEIAYIHIRVGNKRYAAHRLAWFYVYGVMPRIVDHWDGDGTNNALVNLRNTDCAGNNENMKRRNNNTSGFTGVSRHTQTSKWVARIRVRGINIHLGCFDDFDAAVEARIAANTLYGFTGRQERPSQLKEMRRTKLLTSPDRPKRN